MVNTLDLHRTVCMGSQELMKVTITSGVRMIGVEMSICTILATPVPHCGLVRMKLKNTGGKAHYSWMVPLEARLSACLVWAVLVKLLLGAL